MTNWRSCRDRASTTKCTIRRREANDNMRNCPQGLHAFLRAYYHYKSADWKGNKPFRLASLTAEELAKMPTYYIMDLDKGMAETVAAVMPTAAEIAACKWLPDDELAVYTAEYGRTGFQGGLQRLSAHGPQIHRRLANIRRPHDRRAFVVHRRQERLGRVPEPRRIRDHAEDRLHADARRSPHRRSRSLAGAGAAGASEQIAD